MLSQRDIDDLETAGNVSSFVKMLLDERGEKINTDLNASFEHRISTISKSDSDSS